MELRREEHIITRPGGLARRLRAGLQSEQRVPVEEIMSLSGSQALQLVASGGALIERRKQSRAASSNSRLQGRALEFAAGIAIAFVLAADIWSTAEQALAKPLKQASAAVEA